MLSSDCEDLLEVVARKRYRDVLAVDIILEFEDNIVVVAGDHETVIVTSSNIDRDLQEELLRLSADEFVLCI